MLDEAQALKNPRTAAREGRARCCDAEFRVALSGTPLENHLGELWSLFASCSRACSAAGSSSATRSRRRSSAITTPRRAPRSSRVLRPFLLRRTKAEVARELPPRTEIEVPVALSTDEGELYEDARLAAVAQLEKADARSMRDEQRRFEVLAALTRLRLLASHPKLYDPTSRGRVVEDARLLELARRAAQRGPPRARVQPVHVAPRARPRRARRAGIAYLYLDGATPAARARRARSRGSRPARPTCS